MKNEDKTKAELIKELKFLREEREKEVFKDITKSRQAEQAIQESENRFRELFNHMSSGVAVYEAKNDSKDFIIRDFNRAAEKIDKVKKEDIIGKSVLKVFPGVKDLGLFKVFQEVYKTGKPQHHPISLYKDQRITGWRENYTYKLPSDEIVAVYDDITERKQSEKALRESEQKFRDTANLLPQIVYEIDIYGKLTFINKQAFDYFEYSQEEYDKGINVLQTLIPEDKDRAKENMQKKLQGKDVGSPEYTALRKDGSTFPILIYSSAILKDNKPVGLRGIIVDITERKQAEEKLKKSLEASINTMSKIVEVKDPYTAGHQQRVSQLTTAIAKVLNLSPDKVEGIRIASLIHDIGKISVPTEILSKSIRLSDVEFSLIKEHSRIGFDILKAIDFSYPVANIVLQHHEKINGSGYPRGLKGDEILLEAKIICVADVVEAMSSHRPYRPALGIDVALEEISKNKGILYDLEVVDICLKLFKEKGFKFE